MVLVYLACSGNPPEKRGIRGGGGLCPNNFCSTFSFNVWIFLGGGGELLNSKLFEELFCLSLDIVKNFSQYKISFQKSSL